MKYIAELVVREEAESRPARGAWVEMCMCAPAAQSPASRAPQGARGLKYAFTLQLPKREASRPARGAWVEILMI